MDLLYYLRVLLRKKWIILLLTLLATVAAFALLYTKKRLFESAAQYSTGFTMEKVRLVDGTAAVDLYSTDVKFSNVIETFKSPRVIGMLSYRLMLHDLDFPEKAYRRLTAEEKKKPEYRAVSPDTVMRILRAKVNNGELLQPSDVTEKKVEDFIKVYKYDYLNIRKWLRIGRVERTDYLNIVFLSENPELSARVVNTMGQEFLNYYRGLNAQRNQESAKNIEGLVTSQQFKVDSLNNLLRAAKISQGALDPVSRSTSAMETVKELETQLATEKSNYNLHKQLYDAYNDRLQRLSSSGNGGTASRQEVIRLTNRRNDLIAENARRNVPDPGVQKQIEDLNIEIAQKANSGVSNSKIQQDIEDVRNKVREEKALMDAASSTINQINGSIGLYRGMSNVNPGSVVDIEAIERQLDMENKQLESIKEKYNQAEGLVRDDPTINFRQTLIGQPNIEPIPRRTLLTTGLAAISMLFISSLMFLFFELADSSVKTPSQFSKVLKLPLTSLLNAVSLKKNTVEEIVASEFEGKKYKKEVIFRNNIRKLRNQLESSGKKVFLITSTQPGTGKTVLIRALAQAFLLSRKKVLLIDCNFQNNSLTQTYNAETAINDFRLLEGGADQAAAELIRGTAYENLFVIGCREGKASPAELFSMDQLQAMLNKVRDDFDCVFIECAELNNWPDGNELFRVADGVLFVFSAQTVPGPADHKSIDSLGAFPGKNLGAVLNNIRVDNLNF